MNLDSMKKLRWKPGMNVLIMNPPEEFTQEEGSWTIHVEGMDLTEPSSHDLVLLYVKSAADLVNWASPALSAVTYDGLLWIAYPKKTSKIKTDIHRDHGWEPVQHAGFEGVALVSLDDTWSAMRFRPIELVKNPRSTREKETKPKSDTPNDKTERIVIVPDDLLSELDKHPEAKAFFEQLAFTHRKEYVRWITDAKRAETRSARIIKTRERLSQGIKNPHMK